jgi:hypothetical protein
VNYTRYRSFGVNILTQVQSRRADKRFPDTRIAVLPDVAPGQCECRESDKERFQEHKGTTQLPE